MGGSETDKILALAKAVRDEDPDVIFTHGGDSFIFPYLAYRGCVNGVLENLVLSRENVPLKVKKGRGEVSSHTVEFIIRRLEEALWPRAF